MTWRHSGGEWVEANQCQSFMFVHMYKMVGVGYDVCDRMTPRNKEEVATTKLTEPQLRLLRQIRATESQGKEFLIVDSAMENMVMRLVPKKVVRYYNHPKLPERHMYGFAGLTDEGRRIIEEA
jgi:hypothetical protein